MWTMTWPEGTQGTGVALQSQRNVLPCASHEVDTKQTCSQAWTANLDQPPILQPLGGPTAPMSPHMQPVFVSAVCCNHGATTSLDVQHLSGLCDAQSLVCLHPAQIPSTCAA